MWPTEAENRSRESRGAAAAPFTGLPHRRSHGWKSTVATERQLSFRNTKFLLALPHLQQKSCRRLEEIMVV